MMIATEAARAVMLPKLIGAADPSVLMAQAEKGASEAVQRAALAGAGPHGRRERSPSSSRSSPSARAGAKAATTTRKKAKTRTKAATTTTRGDDDEDAGPSPDVSMPGSRRFEFEEDDSSKFWEVVVQDTMCVVRFGKIGSAGQKKPKKLASPEAAQKEMEKLIKEKTGKGYSEVKPRGVAAPKAVARAEGEDSAGRGAAAGAPWGTPALREAAFRALRRAQRTNTRRQNAPKWFTAEQLTQLASNPELAESMMPAVRRAKPARGGGDDDDEGDDDDDEDEDEGDDDE